ncbi:uncharacterized protein LOC141661069 [Apium graveolens]|uniref:uncharacterized protein LOC141661069 n=1 Tax=Apium graveolens TaxID=4045 RepID=UPI003D7AE1A6
MAEFNGGSRGVLLTSVALAGKHVEISTVCSWCQMAEEDDMHILFQCCFARELWEKVGLAELVTVLPGDNVMTLLKRVRNGWVWNRINTSSFGVKARMFNMLEEWNRAREDMQKRTDSGSRTWRKPPEGWFKISVDVVCMLRTGQMGVGCVIRDECGHFMRARSQVVQGCLQSREVEVIGLREALLWIKNWRQSKCIFESDSKVLEEAVNGEGGQSYFHTIVDDCRDILKHFDKVLMMFVPRSANTVAHLLAKATYSMSGLQEWLFTAPEFIICNIASEEV